AQAVREYFVAQGFAANSVRMGIGPVIDNGFYYDFDLPRTLVPEDLDAVEVRMRDIVAADLPLRKYALPRAEALQTFVDLGDPYKGAVNGDLPGGQGIHLLQQGGESGFTDLCRGPHVPSTGSVPPHFKLMSVAGAYWRGDESRPMLQR